MPGQPGQPGGRSRGSRTGLIIGGVAAALLLMVSLGVVVWNVVGGRPYADLPSCRQLLSAEVVETVPGINNPRADGEYEEMDEDEDVYLDEGVLGYLNCAVEDGDSVPLYVSASLHEYEDGGEAAEGLREDVEDALLDLEEGNYGEENIEIADWRPVSAGDEGYAAVFEDSEYGDGGHHGTFFFSTVNVSVSASYSAEEGDFDEAEILDFLDDFASQVERQLSREAERG